MLTLRNASISDADRLFEWRNDSISRHASHNAGNLQFEEHMCWLRDVLDDTDRMLFVCEENGIPVGTVRIDYMDEIANLSWTVAPADRGRGIAKQMVKLAVNTVKKRHLIRAEIKALNLASQKVAEHVGMKFMKREGSICHYIKHVSCSGQ